MTKYLLAAAAFVALTFFFPSDGDKIAVRFFDTTLHPAPQMDSLAHCHGQGGVYRDGKCAPR